MRSVTRNHRHAIGPCLLFVLAALGLALLDRVDGKVYFGDIDDMMRALQIRRLFDGQGFYDRSLPLIAMPGPYLSPWSRIVDIPYVVLGHLLGGLLGSDAGLRLALLVWPPTMLCGFSAILFSTMRSVAWPGKSLRTGPALLALLLLVHVIWEFSPNRIDHHNVQLLMIVMILCGVSLWSPRGACLAGLASVLSVAVGLEMMPIVALVMIAVALAFVIDADGARLFARSYGVTVLLAAPLLALCLLGADGLARTKCDAFSAPYVSGFIGYGLCMASISLLPSTTPRWMSLGLLGLACIVICGALSVSFGACLAGPYAAVDPLTRTLWLDQIRQEHSALSLLSGGDWSFLGAYFAPPVLLVALYPAIRARFRQGDTRVVLLYAVAVGLLLLACIQLRFGRFMGLGVAVLFPLLVQQWQNHRPAMARWLAGGLGGWITAVAAVLLFFPAGPPLSPIFDSHCRDADFSVLQGLPAGSFLTLPLVGMDMLPRLQSGQTVSSVPFHRASPGIHRALTAFVAGDHDSRAEALRPFDYIAACRLDLNGAYDGTLFAALSSGRDWPGLSKVATSAPSVFQVYRIDHDRLR